jgi:phosphohistidine phosphatase
MRHGEAGKRSPLAQRDAERGLTSVGRDDIQRSGKALRDAGYIFDLVATSPLRRAKESATILSQALGRKESPEIWPELSPEGNRAALYRRLSRMKPDSAVLCVGHEPYLTTALGEIISRGEGPTLRISLKKGGLAKVEISGFAPKANGELRWLLTPRQIRKTA